MKGIVLAGGSGTRLYPSTMVVSKQLLPVYDKPMVYYPISVLMLAGIKDILIISTPHDLSNFEKLLGDGSQFGVKFSYKVQPSPDGIAQAFIIGEEFIGNDSVAMVLGDNIFYGQKFSEMLLKAGQNAQYNSKATIFAYGIKNPERFGVVEFDENEKVISIEEKPKNPKSNFAVTGLYFYDNRVVEFAKSLKPSERGELEITDLNKKYLELNSLNVEKFGRGFTWLDTGTHQSLLQASQYVQTIEENQGIKIACPEEIAILKGFISKQEVLNNIKNYHNNEYYEYIKNIPDNAISAEQGTSPHYETSTEAKNNNFEYITLHKSYNNHIYLSWIYKGFADGFEVLQQDNNLAVFETNDCLAHYAILENYNDDVKFYVKAFINTPKGKIYVAQSDIAQLRNRKYSKSEISLVIPAYNAQDYIARSIDSAIATNFEDLEIIIVNDGSTDNTQEIIDWYCTNYSNIISIKKENGGVADARNVGIEVANGNYIVFLDNDDLVRPTMFSMLYDSITENHTDIAIAPLYILYDKSCSTQCNLPFEENKSINIDEYFKILYTTGYYNCAIWNKLYKADLVKNHPLGILKYEDVSWTPCILSWAETFSFVKTPQYEWDRKTRKQTFGDVLAQMPDDELFEHRKQAMMFFINNGNPKRFEELKTVAIRRLNRYLKKSSHPGYKKLIEELS